MTGTTADAVIVFVTDGTSGYLWYYDEDGSAGTTASANEMTFITKLVGVTDIADGDLAFYS